jgi:hypothetical protein
MDWPTSGSGNKWVDSAGRKILSAPIQPQCSVPLFVAEEAYEEYVAQWGRCQTLERLNERGGFGSAELCILLCHRIERIIAENHIEGVQIHHATAAIRKPETPPASA